MESNKSVSFEKKRTINFARCTLKTAKNNINYNNTGIIRLPSVRCFMGLAAFPHSRARIFLSFNFLWGRPSNLRCLNKAKLKEGEGLAQGHTAAKRPRPGCVREGRSRTTEPTWRRGHLEGGPRVWPRPPRGMRVRAQRYRGGSRSSSGTFGPRRGRRGEEARLRGGGGGGGGMRESTPTSLSPGSPSLPTRAVPFLPRCG